MDSVDQEYRKGTAKRAYLCIMMLGASRLNSCRCCQCIDDVGQGSSESLFTQMANPWNRRLALPSRVPMCDCSIWLYFLAAWIWWLRYINTAWICLRVV